MNIRSPSFPADFAEDVFGHVDGNLGGDGQGDGVRGPAVDLDQLAVDADAELGEVGVIAQLADENVLQVSPMLSMTLATRS